MADQPQVRETTESRPEESAPTRVTAAQRPENPQVAFELDPDSKAFGDADTVTVEAGPFAAVEFAGGKSVKVDADHAFVLDSVPGVRRAKS